MKKAVSLFILVFMIFSLCSCQQTEPETVPEYSDDVGEVDYKGAEFVFALRNEEHSTGEEYLGYVVNTEFSDLAIKRV